MRRKKNTTSGTRIVDADMPPVSKEEQQYRLLFDFADYLEQLDRGAVGGAKILLRDFLKKKGLYPE